MKLSKSQEMWGTTALLRKALNETPNNLCYHMNISQLTKLASSLPTDFCLLLFRGPASFSTSLPASAQEVDLCDAKWRWVLFRPSVFFHTLSLGPELAGRGLKILQVPFEDSYHDPEAMTQSPLSPPQTFLLFRPVGPLGPRVYQLLLLYAWEGRTLVDQFSRPFGL